MQLSRIVFLCLYLFTLPVHSQVSSDELLEDIQKLYIGILGRAADQAGQDYWEEEISSGSLTLENVRASFTEQDEYTSIYGDLTNTQLVTLIYQNFLGRDADADGLSYWVGELDAGSINADQMVNAIINAVDDTSNIDSQTVIDRSVLANKVTVATYFTSEFTEQEVNDLFTEAAQEAVANVDSSSSSVDTAMAYVDETLASFESSASVWVINSDNTRSQYIFEENSTQGILVDVQSVEEVVVGNSTYTYVEATGIPSYSVTLSQGEVDDLNARPKADSDFATGSTTASAGEAVEFGEDIGYESRSTCTENGGFGYWPPGPECPENVSHQISFNTNPVVSNSDCSTSLGTTGLYINGTAIFNWGDGQSYNMQGDWQNLAPFAELYDVDFCGGHAAAGEYHHHFYSSCMANAFGDAGSAHSPIYGYAADGYPMYGPWHADGVLATSSWVARDYTANSITGCGSDGVRDCVLVDPYDVSQGVESTGNGPSTSDTVTSGSGNTFLASSGFYYEDYYWDTSLTEAGGEYLDQYNGHEHGGLGYHYHMTIVEDGESFTPSFPFSIGPRYRGRLDGEALTRCTSG